MKPPLRIALAETARAMHGQGLAPGRSGNVSVRLPRGVLITPSGLPYQAIGPSDLVELDRDGRPLAGRYRPSSEWRLHVAIYAARPDAGAIVHTHSRHATALACLRRGIPAFHYMVAKAGGADIRCAPYQTYGSEELAAAAVGALLGRRACLLANHGAVALGTDLDQALELAAEVENLAAQYSAALALGDPAILGDDEMAEIVRRFADYGQPLRVATRPAG